MSTLKELLIDKIESENLQVEDIDFVAVGGIRFKLQHFWEVAATIECEIKDIKDDFIVVFKNNTWISKHYNSNGDVRFKYHKCPKKPDIILLHPKPQEFID